MKFSFKVDFLVGLEDLFFLFWGFFDPHRTWPVFWFKECFTVLPLCVSCYEQSVRRHDTKASTLPLTGLL